MPRVKNTFHVSLEIGLAQIPSFGNCLIYDALRDLVPFVQFKKSEKFLKILNI